MIEDITPAAAGFGAIALLVKSAEVYSTCTPWLRFRILSRKEFLSLCVHQLANGNCSGAAGRQIGQGCVSPARVAFRLQEKQYMLVN